MSLSLLERILKETSGLVLWDEAYGEFWTESAIPFIDRYPNLLILKTFSKAFGLAGLRIGCLLGHPSLLSEIQKVIVPYCINLFSQLAALKLLNVPQCIDMHVEQILKDREILFHELI